LLAHEIGHASNLLHRREVDNLMYERNGSHDPDWLTEIRGADLGTGHGLASGGTISTRTTRRAFIRKGVQWTAALGVTSLFGGCEACLRRIRERPVRRSLATLADDDPIIQTYRAAVAAMKALPASDGRSWQRQAQIHLDHCPHQNWWFLPWHRAYLSYFEQICRDLTGSADFALPYWDWTVDASVPAPFWGNGGNALFQGGRTATSTTTANPNFVGRPVIDSILDEVDFEIFASAAATAQRQRTTYGRLEQTPHNYVHGFVGGVMSTFDSPLDPIFWMHHNMIECLWVEWNLVRGNANTNDPAWSGFQFNGNFFDTAGASVDIQVGTTLLMPLLSYQFDGECGGPGGQARLRRAMADTAALRAHLAAGGPPRVVPVQRYPAPDGFQLSTRAPVSTRVPVAREAVGAALQRPGVERLLLRVEEVRQPRTESFFVRVFVNMPGATPDTGTDDPHYAGSFAFFTDPRHDQADDAMPGAFVVDITETLRRLNTAQALDAVDVQFVAVPIHPGPPLVDVMSAERLVLELARVQDVPQ
jgi:tyrosinase